MRKPSKPSSNHPWKKDTIGKGELKVARKIAKRRYEKASPVRNDEYRRLKQIEYATRTHAKKKLRNAI